MRRRPVLCFQKIEDSKFLPRVSSDVRDGDIIIIEEEKLCQSFIVQLEALLPAAAGGHTLQSRTT